MDPEVELSYLNSGAVTQTMEKPIGANGVWEFPVASISAVELDVAANAE